MNLSKSLIESINYALFIVDSSHKIVYANSAVKDIIGKEPGEILNCYCYNVFTSDLCFKGCPFTYVTESRTSFTRLGVKIYDEDGKVREVNYTAFPYRDEMIDGIAVTLRDADLPVQVIEPFVKDYDHLPYRKQFFSELLQEVGEGVVIVDKSFRIIEFNKVAEEITGFKKEEVYGQPCPNICTFTEEFSCPFDYCLKTKREKEEALSTIIRKNGEPVVVKLKLKILKDGGGNILGGIAIFKQVVGFLKESNEESCFLGLCGVSNAIKQTVEFIKAASLTHSPILISGENGVGKDLVATIIHRLSQNKNERLLNINCPAFPGALIDGEIFGYETDGSRRAVIDGKLKEVGKGTLVLNEISETSLSFQAKIVQLLEKGKYQRLGGTEELTSEARLIFTTSKDLKKEVQKGNFREDLYYILNAFHVHIPPLRERVEDIPILAEHFLGELLKSYGTKLTKKVSRFSDSALQMLQSYEWQGNVLELRNVIEKIYFTIPDDKAIIEPEDLPQEIREYVAKANHLKNYNAEREKLIKALKECDLDKTKAAKLLGISRVTLWRKIINYGITPEELIK